MSALAASVRVSHDEPPPSCRPVDDELVEQAKSHHDAVAALQLDAARRGADWLTVDGRSTGNDASLLLAAGTRVVGRAFGCFDDPALAALRPPTVVAAGEVILGAQPPQGCRALGAVTAADRAGAPSDVRALAAARAKATARGANYGQLGPAARPSPQDLTVEVRLYACPTT